MAFFLGKVNRASMIATARHSDVVSNEMTDASLIMAQQGFISRFSTPGDSSPGVLSSVHITQAAQALDESNTVVPHPSADRLA
jgi:hypothetical protein